MSNNFNRRSFLKTSTQGLLVAPVVLSTINNTGLVDKTDSYGNSKRNELKFVRNKISLNILDFGAKGDGVTINTSSIQLAINRCHVLGGGTVIVPKGNYLTGAIQLRSNINFYLEEDAVISGSPYFEDYPVMQVRWEGKWIQGHAGLIYAVDSENISISGKGKIAGNYTLGGRPNEQKPLRHPALIEPINCKNITFTDFSTNYYLMWSLHPTYCDNLTIQNLNIRSTGENGDGIDLDSCQNVLIENCDIATGDDCISLKSGRGLEGFELLRTTENVTIRGCKLSDSIYACIGIGSESSGGIRNVIIEDCTFYNTKTHAIYIKSRPGRGAFIENISARNLTVTDMETGFLRINQLGSGLQDPNPVPGLEGIPSFKNFSFKNIKVHNVNTLVDAGAIHPSKPLDYIELTNISGDSKYGISLANIKTAVLKNIDVTLENQPPLKIYNVKGKGLEGATSIDFPFKIPDIIPEPEFPFQLK
jgi:hypothetical protein